MTDKQPFSPTDAQQAALEAIAGEPGVEVRYKDNGSPVFFMNGAKVPVALLHFRTKIDAVPYLVERPSSRDIACAVLASRSTRFARWPMFPVSGREQEFLRANDPALLELLDDVALPGDWHILTKAKGEAPGVPVYERLFDKRRQDVGAHTIVRWTLALPQLRSLGELIIEKRLAAALNPQADNEASATEKGGGGRKDKPKPSAQEAGGVDYTGPTLTEEEAAALGLEIDEPAYDGPSFTP